MRLLRQRALPPVLSVVAAALALLASSQVWVTAVVAEPGLPRVAVDADGQDLAPAVAALALVGLAGAVLLLTGRGRVRTGTAAVVAVVGAGVAAASWGPAGDLRAAVAPEVAEIVGRSDAPLAAVDTTAWPWLAVLAGLVLASAGLLALAVRPVARPASAGRYDAEVPGRRAAGRGAAGRGKDGAPADIDLGDEDAVWKALDRGEDPTRGDSPGERPDDPTDEPSADAPGR